MEETKTVKKRASSKKVQKTKLKSFLDMYQGKVLDDGITENSAEFKKFARDLKNVLLEKLRGTDIELIEYRVGYYDVSGYLYLDEGKYIYFSYNEPRHMKLDFFASDCRNGFLIRAAKNERDCGGAYSQNHFCSLVEFAETAIWIFKNNREFERMKAS